jgi:hypothetical protein
MLILFLIDLIDEVFKFFHRLIYQPLEYDSRGVRVRYNKILNRKEFRIGWHDIDELEPIWRKY